MHELVWVTAAQHVENYKVELSFNDGITGIVDLENHLDGRVFEPLKDIEFFKKFELDSWTLTWPNDSDFSPEFLHDLVVTQYSGKKSTV